MRKRVGHLVAAVLISVVFMLLAVRGVEWGLIVDALGRTRLSLLVIACVVALAAQALRAMRWRVIVSATREAGMMGVFSATVIGTMANFLLPARMGELVRVYMLKRSDGVRMSAAAATVVVERVADLFTVLVMLWLLMAQSTVATWLRAGAGAVLAVGLAALCALALLERFRYRAVALVETLLRPLPERVRRTMAHVAHSFLDGLGALGRPALYLPIVLLSVGVHAAMVVVTWLCLWSMGLEVSWLASLSVQVCLCLASIIPGAMGNIGIGQWACMVALEPYGIEGSVAFAFSWVIYAACFVPITLVGMPLLWRQQLTMRDLKAERIEQDLSAESAGSSP
jgi:uncharacterized protein (TIRG00374 family)